MNILPVLLALFVGSGCAALILEIVWLQLLQFTLGSTALSLGTLLGTFMGGMCLGSLALPRLVSARRHPLRVYAAIELGIGVLAIVALYGLPYLNRLYAAGAGYGLPEMLLRGALAALCLLPPTMLMGASLPAMARWVETTPRGVAWLGFFYGGNIAGAVLGCLLAGFYLLRVHDMATATYTAAAINAGVALIAYALAAVAPCRGAEKEAAPAPPARNAWPVYVAIAVSGLCALGAEVVWTRLLSLMLGATVYTFSIILSVFLLGLGIGSSAGSVLSRGRINPRAALAVCQVSAAAAIAWAAWLLARELPYWQLGTNLSQNLWLRFGFDSLRCLLALLPAALLWGASFPLALAAIARRGQDPGRLVGRVYAANTLGAIAGALAFSLVLIPAAGTQNSQRLLVALAAAAAVLALPRISVMAAAAPAALLVWTLPAVPWGVVASGRQLNTMSPRTELLYLGEGLNASVVVGKLDDIRTFHVSGKIEASSGPQDMRLQRLLGHLPALVHPQPRSVLVVGCGAGVTAGSFVPYPEVGRIVLCEIEPLIPPVADRFFGPQNHRVLRDPRTQTVFDDARHYIFSTREQFDIVTSDPIHPWVKGSATLYTREYFEMCKRRLKPGGIVTQWVPLYESTPETVKSEIATFFEVFPHGTIWANDTILGEGYDVVLLGHAGDRRIDLDAIEEKLRRPDHAAAAQALREVGFGSGVSVLATYAGRLQDLRPWLRGAQINRDRNLRLQYLAGIGLNQQGAYRIYEDLLRYCVFPDNLFTGSMERKQALRAALRAR